MLVFRDSFLGTSGLDIEEIVRDAFRISIPRAEEFMKGLPMGLPKEKLDKLRSIYRKSLSGNIEIETQGLVRTQIKW